MTYSESREYWEHEMSRLHQRWIYTPYGSAAEDKAHDALQAAYREWSYYDTGIRNGEGE